ncbi:TylF/MycF family methyltransferase [Aestuariibacter halophilus]|uniref:TylF/MycF family methyltransferase n=1 Tax=Fluctibacter halophilus TaxID=226011 RepID=A0ABS8G3G5_9ALTE|nr:TylF/MycF/NovP-related O-methyltransferase [Aestuariibacter halophilus]MCC2615122.1 TylF/MycF family methyltransferase [Aestuariibacter halophilus]
MSQAFEQSPLPVGQKLDNFEKYVRRQQISRFLARYELFKRCQNIKGSIVECGVYQGAGVMAWAKLSAMMEPYALDRRVIGFDSFDGFPSVAEQDTAHAQDNVEMKPEGLATGDAVYQDLLACIAEHDDNRFLNHIPKIELVKGDACATIPDFVANNPHLIINLLFLDFDLYEPTKVAIEHLLPRVPKGGIVVFDEINNPWWPGETVALMEHAGLSLNQLQIERFSFDPNIAFIQL